MADSIDIALLAAELRTIVGQLKRVLRERGSVGDFKPSQLGALHHLDRHGPATVSALARACGMRPQSMRVIVAALQAQGMVAGSPDPADGRQTLIAMTPLFKKRVAVARARHEDWFARRIERLSKEEQAHLAAAVAILRRISEP